MSTVDLGVIAGCGPRRARAGAMLEGMLAAGRDVLGEGPAVAFVVVAEGNADLDAGTLADVLALAVLRLAERGGHESEPSSAQFYCVGCDIKHEPPLHHEAAL